ncbi:hypothetical protein K402DRAFT_396289 [Aulographum hederae CBS 113979]|uniref:Uncharacterized protein n=1 Tax=Aulographum hederae CBS 113979 TaxID=1176131 RepID=A0A6G1GSA9_9PEZI|nr:hypothetical protein K402DRAFT_396289 [Aulographum hederae CBS 113979]
MEDCCFLRALPMCVCVILLDLQHGGMGKVLVQVVKHSIYKRWKNVRMSVSC